MVKDKDSTSFRIESNFRNIIDPKPTQTKVTNFANKIARKSNDYINSLSDSRKYRCRLGAHFGSLDSKHVPKHPLSSRVSQKLLTEFRRCQFW